MIIVLLVFLLLEQGSYLFLVHSYVPSTLQGTWPIKSVEWVMTEVGVGVKMEERYIHTPQLL